MRGWLKKAMESAAPSALSRSRRAAAPAAAPEAHVTLVVYGWNNAEPGTLAWVFPSLTAAMLAVRVMKNAVRWAIVSGKRADANVDVELARASGLVLAEAA